jgi:hypothetical protein
MLTGWKSDERRCRSCGMRCAGVFEEAPRARRLPVRLADFAGGAA